MIQMKEGLIFLFATFIYLFWEEECMNVTAYIWRSEETSRNSSVLLPCSSSGQTQDISLSGQHFYPMRSLTFNMPLCFILSLSKLPLILKQIRAHDSEEGDSLKL